MSAQAACVMLRLLDIGMVQLCTCPEVHSSVLHMVFDLCPCSILHLGTMNACVIVRQREHRLAFHHINSQKLASPPSPSTYTFHLLMSQLLTSNIFCRRHPLPSERKMKELLELTQELGIHLDASSSGGLHRTLQAAREALVHGPCAEALTLMLTKPMQLAQYFCTGDVSSCGGGLALFVCTCSICNVCPQMLCVHSKDALALSIGVQYVQCQHLMCGGKISERRPEY